MKLKKTHLIRRVFFIGTLSVIIYKMSKAKDLIKKTDVKFDEPNISDRVLDRLFLWIFPEFVIPNHLTIFRYATVPLVFYLLLYQRYLLGFVLFTISVFTDALDGAMARTRDKITDWGKLHDPLADKLLIGVAGAVLITRYIDFRIILIILVLEMFTVLSAIHLHDNKEKEIGARLPGKIKMICQSVAIISLLIYSLFQFENLLTVSSTLLYLAIFFSTINIFLYRAL